MHESLKIINASKLAQEHYENFPVARFVRKDLRKDIQAIYAFARVADDFADEPEYEGKRLELLHLWRQNLHDCAQGKVDSLIFENLLPVLHEKKLPLVWLEDLLDAFEYDVKHARHDSFEALLKYAKMSANPVGRCVLFLHAYTDESIYKDSDALCTALQLTNFWQDIGLDAKRGRFYVPQIMLKRYSCTEEQMVSGQFDASFKALIEELCFKTKLLFEQAKPLAKRLKFPLSLEVNLTHLGGQEILKKIGHQHYNTLNQRPKLNKLSFVKLFFKALCSRDPLG